MYKIAAFITFNKKIEKNILSKKAKVKVSMVLPTIQSKQVKDSIVKSCPPPKNCWNFKNNAPKGLIFCDF